MPPSSRSASEKIAGSGLRMPTSLESITASNSSASGSIARQPCENSRALLVTSAVRRPRARSRRVAATTASRAPPPLARHAREDHERVEREPVCRARAP